MIQRGQHLFVSVGGGPANMLEPVSAAPSQGDGIELRFVDDGASIETIEPGQNVMLYFSHDRRFMQQPARVMRLLAEERAIVIETVGEASCGESRQCYRVCTVLVDYYASVGCELTCQIMNVSAMGLSAICEEQYAIRDTVPVSFMLGDKLFAGECVVQSTRPVRAGWRYGLYCITGPGSGNLDQGLHRMTAVAQRTQLRRLSGAA